MPGIESILQALMAEGGDWRNKNFPTPVIDPSENPASMGTRSNMPGIDPYERPAGEEKWNPQQMQQASLPTQQQVTKPNEDYGTYDQRDPWNPPGYIPDIPLEEQSNPDASDFLGPEDYERFASLMRHFRKV